MGKRTSVYLSDDLAAAVEASGVPLGELVRRGLAAAGAQPVFADEIARRSDQPVVTRSNGAARDGAAGPRPARIMHAGAQSPGRRRCPHPGTRTVGGWCRECGVVVESGGYLPG